MFFVGFFFCNQGEKIQTFFSIQNHDNQNVEKRYADMNCRQIFHINIGKESARLLLFLNCTISIKKN